MAVFSLTTKSGFHRSRLPHSTFIHISAFADSGNASIKSSPYVFIAFCIAKRVLRWLRVLKNCVGERVPTYLHGEEKAGLLQGNYLSLPILPSLSVSPCPLKIVPYIPALAFHAQCKSESLQLRGLYKIHIILPIINDVYDVTSKIDAASYKPWKICVGKSKQCKIAVIKWYSVS